jgi:hypothetical protein
MSLVYEALQKAEREKQRKAGVFAPSSAPKPVPTATPQPQPQPIPAPIPASPARSSQPVLVGVMVCLSVVALLAIVYLVANAARPSAPPVTATVAASAPVAKPSTPTESPAAQAPLNPIDGRFHITGIMRNSDGKYGAVLNGRVVYEGHYVDGATVKSITEDRVILDINGQEAVVRLY